MTMLVESYVAGRWHGPAGQRTALLNASTAEPVAVIGTAPIDMVPVLDHARSVGGPALREMPFHERALALKALATHLNGKREHLYAISSWTGAPTPRMCTASCSMWVHRSPGAARSPTRQPR